MNIKGLMVYVLIVIYHINIINTDVRVCLCLRVNVNLYYHSLLT